MQFSRILAWSVLLLLGCSGTSGRRSRWGNLAIDDFEHRCFGDEGRACVQAATLIADLPSGYQFLVFRRKFYERGCMLGHARACVGVSVGDSDETIAAWLKNWERCCWMGSEGCCQFVANVLETAQLASGELAPGVNVDVARADKFRSFGRSCRPGS